MLFQKFLLFFCLDLHCIPKHGKSGRTRVHCSRGDKAVKNIAKGNFSAGVCSMESMKSHMVNYSKQADNMLRVSPPNSASAFSNSQYYQQLCRMCPRLVCLLAAICKSGKPATLKKNSLSELGKCDVEPKLRNAIYDAASVCLHQYNPKTKCLPSPKWPDVTSWRCEGGEFG